MENTGINERKIRLGSVVNQLVSLHAERIKELQSQILELQNKKSVDAATTLKIKELTFEALSIENEKLNTEIEHLYDIGRELTSSETTTLAVLEKRKAEILQELAILNKNQEPKTPESGLSKEEEAELAELERLLAEDDAKKAKKGAQEGEEGIIHITPAKEIRTPESLLQEPNLGPLEGSGPALDVLKAYTIPSHLKLVSTERKTYGGDFGMGPKKKKEEKPTKEQPPSEATPKVELPKPTKYNMAEVDKDLAEARGENIDNAFVAGALDRAFSSVPVHDEGEEDTDRGKDLRKFASGLLGKNLALEEDKLALGNLRRELGGKWYQRFLKIVDKKRYDYLITQIGKRETRIAAAEKKPEK